MRADLQSQRITMNREGLQKYLQQITEIGDRSVAKKLISQLGSRRFQVRALAQQSLLKLREIPLDLLREASKNSLEEQLRVDNILNEYLPRQRQTVEKVFRAIELLNISGLTKEILVAVNKFQDKKRLSYSAKRAMSVVVTKEDVPLLSRQMSTKTNAAVRDICISALRQLEDPTLADRLEKWAQNKKFKEGTRLESGLALADLGDRRSLDVLVGLMVEAESPSVRAVSVRALRVFTGKRFAYNAYAKQESRVQEADAWKKWIAANGETAELNYPPLPYPNRVRQLHQLRGHTKYVDSMAIDPTGKLLASASRDATVRLWDIRSGRSVAGLKGGNAAVYHVAVSADGKTVISADALLQLTFWDVANRKNIATVRAGFPNGIRSLAVSPAGKYLAACGFGGTQLWDIDKRESVARLPDKGYVNGLAFSDDGRYLVTTGGKKQTVRVWDVETRTVIKELRFNGRNYPRAMALTPDGGTVLVAAGSLVKVFDVKTGRQIDELKGHTGKIYTVAVHPDGRTIITSGEDRTVRIWDRFNGRELAKLNTAKTSIRVVGPKGLLLAGADDRNNLSIWE
ncbi:MAG: HEAT repeat domain-containing protein [Gemmataceae bacterium]